VRAQAVGAYEGAIPLTIILDQENKVYAVWNGYAPGVESQVEATIAELLPR
jgi:hypothetical protein